MGTEVLDRLCLYPKQCPGRRMSWCKMLCTGSVCGTVISRAVHTGDPRAETILAFCLPRKWHGDRRVPKSHLRAFGLCPMAELEIERVREGREGCEEEAEEGGGFVLAADLDSKCQTEKQPLWSSPTRLPTSRLYSQ